jgi:hypothetical protein
MRRMVSMVVALLALSPGVLAAQTVVDLSKAKFYWDWTQGTAGPATEFRIKCGPAVGTYPTIVAVSPTLRVFPVNQVIGSSGSYHCIITAANQYGESAPSAEVFFAAGVAPSSPSNLRVTP